MLPRRARVDLGAMAIKGYSAFPKAPALLELHYQIVSYPGHSLGGGLISLQRSSQCILQPQPIGQPFNSVEKIEILVCKHISSNTFKKNIHKLFTYKSYVYFHLNVCKQMTVATLLLLHCNTWNYLTLYKQPISCKWNYSYKIEIFEFILPFATRKRKKENELRLV